MDQPIRVDTLWWILESAFSFRRYLFIYIPKNAFRFCFRLGFFWLCKIFFHLYIDFDIYVDLSRRG